MNILQKALLIRRLNHQFYSWDRQQLQAHQQHRLQFILDWARRNSPYYGPLLQANMSWADVPVMGKTTMMEHFDVINTQGLDRDDLRGFRMVQERTGSVELYQGRYSVGLSSGTSGNQGLTVLSRAEQQRYGCLLFARSGIPASIKPKNVLFALRLNNAAFQQVQSFGVTLVYVDYTRPIAELVRMINERKLNILAGPPSLLTLLAEAAETMDHGIDAVVSYAEVLDENTKRKLEETFDCRVVQIYQASEGFIGSTCRRGALHLNEDVLYPEILDTEDSAGDAKNILITDLYRTTQPIIRYQMNDLLELDPNPCACGSCFRVIQRIHGRQDDSFLLRDSQGQWRHLFPDYVRRSIIQASQAISSYQALQIAADQIEIRLILEADVDRRSIEKAITDNLAYWIHRIGAQQPAIHFSDASPERNARSGKMIRVVRCFAADTDNP